MNRQTTLTTLIVSQVVYFSFGIVWLFFAVMSTMMFDNPSGPGLQSFVTIFILFLLYPLAFLASIISGWVLFAKRKYKAAFICNWIPLPWVLAMIGIIVYITGSFSGSQ